jgi:hypothetical protein
MGAFWNTPCSARGLALLRITFGTLALIALIEYFSQDILVGGSYPRSAPLWLNWLEGRGPSEVRLFLMTGIFFAIATILGVATPLSLGCLSLILLNLRNHCGWAAGEGGLQVIHSSLLILTLTPCGRDWSWDCKVGWWQKGSLWNGPIRILQLLQICIYLQSGIYKLMGIDWWRGDGLWMASANHNFSKIVAWLPGEQAFWPLPQLITWLVLIWELTFPLWLLHRWTRLAAIAIGLLMHLSLWLAFDIGLYPPAMMALYLTFYPTPKTSLEVSPSRLSRGACLVLGILILWSSLPTSRIFPDGQAGSPIPALASLEGILVKARSTLLATPPGQCCEMAVQQLGLNHRYNTFSPNPANMAVLYRLRDESGRVLWSCYPGQGPRYNWTVVTMRFLATRHPEALPVVLQQFHDRLPGSPSHLVLEEWAVDLGQPLSAAQLNRNWIWQLP